jgi:hypothetical protein
MKKLVLAAVACGSCHCLAALKTHPKLTCLRDIPFYLWPRASPSVRMAAAVRQPSISTTGSELSVTSARMTALSASRAWSEKHTPSAHGFPGAGGTGRFRSPRPSSAERMLIRRTGVSSARTTRSPAAAEGALTLDSITAAESRCDGNWTYSTCARMATTRARFGCRSESSAVSENSKRTQDFVVAG